jgi:hypothetical protein
MAVFLELTRNATVPGFGVLGKNRTGLHDGAFEIFRCQIALQQLQERQLDV